MTELTIVCGGVDVRDLGAGYVGEVEVSHKHSTEGSGLHYVKWSLALPDGFGHPALQQGTLVQVLAGPISLGWAMLADPVRGTGEFVADGLYRRAEVFPGFTTNPSKDATTAIADGIEWASVGTLPNASVSTTVDAQNQATYLADTLTGYARANNLRWGLDAARVPYMVADPATPTIMLGPDVPAMATADDDSVNAVRVRYVSQVSGGDPVAWGSASATRNDGRPRRWRVEDVTGVGLTNATSAQAFAQRVLDSFRPVPAFTEAVQVVRGQVTTTGDTPIDLWTAGLEVCGKRVAHLGVLDSDGGIAYGQTLEWVVGQTVYRPAEETLVMTPVEIASRTEAQFVQDAAARKRRSRLGLDGD